MTQRGNRHARSAGGAKPRRALFCEPLEPRRLLSSTLNVTATPAIANSSVSSGTVSGYTPSQVLHAYGFDAAASSIGAVGGTGAGQTIAIVDAYHDPTLSSDVDAFDAQFGMAAPPSLTVINQTGGASNASVNAVWTTETSLDVEWAHTVAPAASIIVVEANSAQLSDLLTAVDTARHLAKVSIVSMSWGVNEFPTETAYDTIFTTPSGHQNITFVASSGDTATSTSVQWPATSPNVVSVGGSTLTVNATVDGQAMETSYPGAVSGISKYEPKPTYQDALSTASNRTSPDVVYDANVSPGFAVFNSASGGWETLGGTSSGAPQWAGLVAIANQVRGQAGKSPLNGASQTLPSLYSYYKANRDATLATQKSANTAAAGALISSSGTPQATFVIDALSSAKPAATTTTTPNQPIATLLANAPHRTAHPAVLNVVPPAPLIHFAEPFAAPIRLGPSLATVDLPQTRAAAMDRKELAGGGAEPTGLAATSLLAIALPEMLAAAHAPSAASQIARYIESMYGEIPALGASTVVPVGTGATLLAVPIRTSWYIAHIDVAATFSDAIAAFTDDSAFLSRGPAIFPADDSPHDHVRAWAITGIVLAMDALIVYYLATRRRRAVDAVV